jgi:protein SCO1/2/putative membrane protein
VSRSYRIGIGIVVATVAASSILCFSLTDPNPPTRAGYDLGPASTELGAFRFAERSGREVTEADLADRVWVAAFVFSRCPSSCPRISAEMARLQAELPEDSPVRLVSISVDPGFDTPEVLTDFARRYGADPDRWWFLTGDREETYELITRGFIQSVAEASEEDVASGSEAILHSTKLALVDRGNRVVGLFDIGDEVGMARLRERLPILSAPAWARKLPAVNASLNGSCAVLLLVGWISIRAKQVKAHTIAQVAALGVSAVFLACYLVYHYQVGSVKFSGVGPARPSYFSILLSHTVLAIVMVPMILVTVVRALRRRFDRHRTIAQVTFPIWLYVSITGVVIYLMLYQLDFSTTAMAAGL